jgi:hypothetical protein
MAAVIQLPAYLATDSRQFHTNLLVFSTPSGTQVSSELVAQNRPDYNVSAWTSQKTPFPTVTLLLNAIPLQRERVYRAVT